MVEIDKKVLEVLKKRFGDLSTITGDDLRQFVAETVRSFLGAKEGSTKHMMLIDIYNEQEPLPRGYKMTLKDAWCAAAAVAWSIMAGVGEIVPMECSCLKLIEIAKKMGIWVENEAKHKAQVGDWCLFDWEDDGKGDNVGSPNHVGIVTERGEKGFTTTEGNNNNRVADRNMMDNAAKIRGFICPDYDALAATIREAVTVAGFADVPQGVYYQEDLEWAAEKGLVIGVADGLFAPDKALTRAEAVEMLYRHCGEKVDPAELPFGDIAADAWYLEALEWAWDQNIVIGRSETEFGPDEEILRCELAAMLHRLEGCPKPKGTNSPFEDTPATAWYTEAVTWAWERGIVKGVGGHRFAPVDGLLRRDAVCMMHRWYQQA